MFYLFNQFQILFAIVPVITLMTQTLLCLPSDLLALLWELEVLDVIL